MTTKLLVQDPYEHHTRPREHPAIDADVHHLGVLEGLRLLDARGPAACDVVGRVHPPDDGVGVVEPNIEALGGLEEVELQEMPVALHQASVRVGNRHLMVGYDFRTDARAVVLATNSILSARYCGASGFRMLYEVHVTSEEPEINPVSAATPLYLACVELRDAWTALRANDGPHDGTAPYSAASSLPEPQEYVLRGAQFATMFAVDSVLDHLRALALSYEPAARARTGWPVSGWPGVASYTTGRAILEGCALAAWFSNPEIDVEERLRRGARVLLWSLSEELTGPNPPSKDALNFWREKIESSGMRIRNSGRRWGIEIDGKARYYSHQAAIDELIPTHGREFYHEWSGLAHHVAWAFADRGQLRVDDNGSGLRFSLRIQEDHHYILLINVAGIIAPAGHAVAQYFGRSSDALLQTYGKVYANLEAELPLVEAAVRRAEAQRDA